MEREREREMLYDFMSSASSFFEEALKGGEIEIL